MKDLTLSQQCALVGLDGQDSRHGTLAKRAVCRAIAAARLLEAVGEEVAAKPAGDAALAQRLGERLEQGLCGVRKQKRLEAKRLEEEAAGQLLAEGLLEEVPDILGCDINYATSGVELFAWRADSERYSGIVEGLRAEILEDGPVSWETACLLWLFGECGCLHDMFSVEEQKRLDERMVGLGAGDPVLAVLWQAEFHSGLERAAVGFLKRKENLFRNPYLQGVNLIFPFLDRRKSIFIDFVVLGTNVRDRRLAVLAALSERGHYVEEVRNGEETLLKIDNCYYRIFPGVRRYYKVPVQGGNLVPVYR